MTATLPHPRTSPDHIVLHDVSWRLYELLLEEVGDSHLRITYDRGRLEIMSPRPEHEMRKRWIGMLIELITLERDIPFATLGSTTWRREDLQKGLEPDECYYIQNELLIRGRNDIDLRRDPPPDLVVEIDITHHEIDREAIYAAIGVPEIWRDNGSAVEFLELTPEGAYRRRETSVAFPDISAADLNRFLSLFQKHDHTTARRMFVDWLRQK